ncbi:hypothetical protein TEA_011030 [Camellia sinensis var. sinensis]|uniref:RecF/RecN/SMC N-terminal domain-containing protein n=1 Tax=Camellia sinensis var. sinensis TaxID=542762 RepID=A0A4S4DKH1_CAMSN|nr:hypothetical protein TEA_011030 [Camellia sinensis var. sinensis]
MDKAQVQSASKDLKHANENERLLMEMEAIKQECASLKSQLVSLKQQINNLTSEVDGLKTKMKERDTQISCILREQQELQHKIIKRMEMEQKNCSLKVKKLIEKHAWITLEKHRFGRSGTDFDFASCDPHTARKDFEKLQAKAIREFLTHIFVISFSLEKQVNKKVMEMFEKSEYEYNHLISKKNVIKNDKTKINMVIAELDEKKKETLKVTWVKSLSELSGGQRSLLALSLILALLLFKPAPLYILDEVDAALDLSHTQNIRRMIKTQFPHSQSIVVSLKEGMFNNANVLFRTKFVDGISTDNLQVADSHHSWPAGHWSTPHHCFGKVQQKVLGDTLQTEPLKSKPKSFSWQKPRHASSGFQAELK